MHQENKLRQVRIANHLTQEELATRSGISIRTIQRMEKGVSQASSHTLKTLAKALNVPSESLLQPINGPSFEKKDVNILKLLNFSILSVLLVPFGNLILPTLIFLRNKTNKHVNEAGRKIIGFQIVATFFLFFLSVLIFLFVGRGNGAIPLPVFISYSMIVLVNCLIVIRTSLDIDQNKEVLKFFPNLL